MIVCLCAGVPSGADVSVDLTEPALEAAAQEVIAALASRGVLAG